MACIKNPYSPSVRLVTQQQAETKTLRQQENWYSNYLLFLRRSWLGLKTAIASRQRTYFRGVDLAALAPTVGSSTNHTVRKTDSGIVLFLPVAGSNSVMFFSPTRLTMDVCGPGAGENQDTSVGTSILYQLYKSSVDANSFHSGLNPNLSSICMVVATSVP